MPQAALQRRAPGGYESVTARAARFYGGPAARLYSSDFRMSSVCSSGLTRRSALETLPFASITKLDRSMPMDVLPYLFFSTHTPYASAVAWSGSERSVNGRPYFSLNL